jgi:hypothetical protein
MTSDSTAERSDPPAEADAAAESLFQPPPELSVADIDQSPPAAPGPMPRSDPDNPFRRMEQLLAEIRAHLDASARETRIRQFSLARLAAALLQALVVGLVVWSLSDWLFAMEPAGLGIKLGFAAVFELGVIAALLAARDPD